MLSKELPDEGSLPLLATTQQYQRVIAVHDPSFFQYSAFDLKALCINANTSTSI
jgi:hypothetical protein